jgi:hypothetical protein
MKYQRFIALIALLLATNVMQGQDLEARVTADLKAMGYDVQKADNGAGYNISQPASMYEDAKMSYYLSVTKAGKTDLIFLATWVTELGNADSVAIGRNALFFMKRNSYVPCATYNLVNRDSTDWAVTLVRLIESNCYSKELVKGVMDCMANELESASAGRGYADSDASTSADIKKYHEFIKQVPAWQPSTK